MTKFQWHESFGLGVRRFPWRAKQRQQKVKGKVQRHSVTVTTFKDKWSHSDGPHTQYHLVVNYKSYSTTSNTINAAYLATAKVNDDVYFLAAPDGSILNLLSIEYRDPVSSISLVELTRWFKRLIALEYR